MILFKKKINGVKKYCILKNINRQCPDNSGFTLISCLKTKTT